MDAQRARVPKLSEEQDVNEGEIVGLLGRSGSGKSTLLRSIAGLVSPGEGELAFVPGADGAPPSVAMAFQSFALMPWLTALQTSNSAWRHGACLPKSGAGARSPPST